MSSYFFTFPVYYEDTDAGGIVYHANYLRFAERARTQMLKDLGFSNKYFMQSANPVGFAVRDCSLSFKRPARLEDVLTVETKVTKITGTSMFFSQIIRRENEDLVDISMRVVALNKQMRPTRLPNELVDLFREVKE